MKIKLGEETIKVVLGIREGVPLTFKDMINNLTVAFSPICNDADAETISFYHILKKALHDLGVNVIPYEQALDINGKIKERVAVVNAGYGKTGNLTVDNIASLRSNSVVNIVKIPDFLSEKASFEEHMVFSASLFSQYMANIIICISKGKWIVYSLNGFSPIHNTDKNFKRRITKSLIPKLVAILKPPLLGEFKVEKWNLFYRSSHFYDEYINDIIDASKLFKQTSLYPPAKSFEVLKFRNSFYKRIGRMYLDKRSGMSYGFFARQLPPKISIPISIDVAKKRFNSLITRDYFYYENNIYIKFIISNQTFFMKVPDVWMITTRSGCEKTDLDPNKDLIKLGLVNGQMVIGMPADLDISKNYRPSFDTKLILSHGLANAIYGSLLKYFKPDSFFANILFKQGIALAHWHTIYALFKTKPKNWHIYGTLNPAVCCSTDQSAIYAFRGRESFFSKLILYNKEYEGDIHIEMHHGVNVIYPSLVELANILLSYPEIFQLGALKSQIPVNADS
jgi:hypothetical protein